MLPLMEPFTTKIQEISALFNALKTPQEKYERLIGMGRALEPFPKEQMLEENLVPGCQSRLYLTHTLKEGKITFLASSDALISAGLAALLLAVYNGESPETVIQNKPLFAEELGILASLSPTRANGLANLYLEMRKATFKEIVKK